MNEIKKYSDFQIAEILEQNNKLIASLTNQVVEQNNSITEKNIQLETWDRVSNSDNWFEMGSVSKLLNVKNCGRNKLFEFLRGNNILRYNNEPYQQFVDREYFKLIEQEVTLPSGDTMINRKTVISQKGIDYIRKALDKMEIENDSNTEN